MFLHLLECICIIVYVSVAHIIIYPYLLISCQYLHSYFQLSKMGSLLVYSPSRYK